jgi:hypothetical protein
MPHDAANELVPGGPYGSPPEWLEDGARPPSIVMVMASPASTRSSSATPFS